MGLNFGGLCAVGAFKSVDRQTAKEMACTTARGEFAKFIKAKVTAAAKKAAQSLSNEEAEDFKQRAITGVKDRAKMITAGVGCPRGHEIKENGRYTFWHLAVFEPAAVKSALSQTVALKGLSEKQQAAIKEMDKEVTKELGL